MSQLHRFPEPGYIMFFYLSQQRFMKAMQVFVLPQNKIEPKGVAASKLIEP
jgi:hypothetical protein